MKEVGNPTPLCRQLRERKDKPHYAICDPLCDLHFYLWATNFPGRQYFMELADFRTPGAYKTSGEAARAWHSYGRKA